MKDAWEYREEITPSLKKLNDLGTEGWEVVNIKWAYGDKVSYGGDNILLAFLKRKRN
jgi:hypothetical protein